MSLIPRIGNKNARFLVTWILLVITSALVGYIAHIQIHFLLMLTSNSSKTFQFVSTNDQNNLHKTVIVSSYYKSGADMIGDLLGNRPQTFYAIEPLITLGIPKYIQDENTICTNNRVKCTSTPTTSNYLNIMTNLLQCNRTGIFGDGTYSTKWEGGGSTWTKYRECLSENPLSKELCYRYLSHKCSASQYRVVRDTSLSLKVLGNYLKNYENVTVVHVFRDPRGIINEFLKKDRSAIREAGSRLSDFASGLCTRMRDDIVEGKELAALYPKRFKMMLYEDFGFDMASIARPLFRFLNFPLVAQDMSYVSYLQNGRKPKETYKPTKLKLPPGTIVNSNKDTNKVLTEKGLETLPLHLNPFFWRKELSDTNLRSIDLVCKDLYSKLGYNTYETGKILRNMEEVPSYGNGGIYPF